MCMGTSDGKRMDTRDKDRFRAWASARGITTSVTSTQRRLVMSLHSTARYGADGALVQQALAGSLTATR